VRRVRRTLLLLLAVAAAALVATVGGSDRRGEQAGRVVRVVDGDTIHVALGGRRERVRYIGVDTPEVTGRDECFGQAATAFNRRLVAGARVRLRTDAERRDRYGRLLAYVHLAADGRFVNAEIVRRGYARPLAIAPNVRHARRFAALAREARRAQRGLWRAC
jgi:micrococcal nuclease